MFMHKYTNTTHLPRRRSMAEEDDSSSHDSDIDDSKDAVEEEESKDAAPAKKRWPNRQTPPCPDDFSCIYDGCKIKCKNKKQWKNHIKGSKDHKRRYAALPAATPGSRAGMRATNKQRPVMFADKRCPFPPCDKTFDTAKQWTNHVVHHTEYLNQPAKKSTAKARTAGKYAKPSVAASLARCLPQKQDSCGGDDVGSGGDDGDGPSDFADDDVFTSDEGAASPVPKRRRGDTSCASPPRSPRRPNVVIPNEEGYKRVHKIYPLTDDANTCPVCKVKTYKTKELRDKHIREKHSEVYNNYDDVPKKAAGAAKRVFRLYPEPDAAFTCPVPKCATRLSNLQSWKNHIRGQHRSVYDDYRKVPTLSAPAAAPRAESGKGAKKRKHPAADEALSCPYCDWTNPGSELQQRKNARYNHMSTRHSKEVAELTLRTDTPRTEYVCDNSTNASCACAYYTASKQKWEAHLGARTHACRNGCGATFTNSGDEGSHAKLHCPSRAQEHVCGIDGCTETSNSLGGIQQHRAGPKHVVPDRKYLCTVVGCEYRHQHPSKLAAHTREVHTDSRPFVCSFVDGDGDSCGKGFKSNGDLTKHGGVHVETYDIPCATCEKLYKTPRLRALHEAVVHGEQRFACPEPGCASAFAAKLARDQHAKIHSDVREYACSQCPQTFRQLSVCQNHEMYVHLGTRAHQCAACGLVLTSPSRLATHERVHTDGYVPGSVSVGEQEIFRILQTEFSLGGFRKEATPLGKRFRFDFMVGGTFIEYDGLYHYRPGHAAPYKPAALCRFALQVMSDYKKTSFCRKHGAPLLRVTGTLPSDAAFLACLAAATSAPADYSDYVAGHTLTTDLAEHFRVLASQDPLAGEPKPTDVEAEAGELVASVTILGPALLHDEAMDVYQTRIAAFLIFLRENAALSPQEAADAYGAEVMDACIIIARSMPEFNGAPVLRAAAALDLVTLTAAHAAVSVLASPVAVLGPYPVPPTAASVPSAAAPVALRGHGIVRVRDPFIVCWICKIQWANNTRSADLLLRHVNDVHAGGYYVRCATCPTAFHCYDDKTRAGQVGDAAAAHRVQEQHGAHCTRHVEKADHVSKTSRCGHCDSAEVFSTRFRLFRHFNDAHGAGFSHWCTLQCPICLSRNFRTLPNLEGHTCGV